MEKQKKKPSAEALARAYAVPSEADPEGMYTGVPAAPAYRTSAYVMPQSDTPDAACPGGKVYCSAENLSRLTDGRMPLQDADDL